ncbi:MAG: glycosyltransferase [Phycisphaerales bacterium]|nr:glycosyltransferase [Phycisphaerales bacterium]
MILIVIVGFFLCLYVLLLLLYRIGYQLQQSFIIRDVHFTTKTKISVVVAARNESANIEKCIQHILRQNYPQHLFELIIVDDFSTDDTVQLVRNFDSKNLRLLSLVDYLDPSERIIAYKKKALSIGIEHSEGSLIVTTDADCWMQSNWLKNIAALQEQSAAQMIVAPVRFRPNSSILQLFQSLDFTTMQGITAATIRLNLGIMCNGANVAFTRKAYDDVKGYDGVDDIISGDDYLLMMKIKKRYPQGIQYLKSKEAIVDTLPQFTWYSFLQQRIRWASKMGKYEDTKTSIILLLVYLFNCLLAALFLISFIIPDYFCVSFLYLMIKIIFELLFLWPVAKLFNTRFQLLAFPFLQPLHILYIIVAGFLSRIGRFEWKSRNSIQITNPTKK